MCLHQSPSSYSLRCLRASSSRLEVQEQGFVLGRWAVLAHIALVSQDFPSLPFASWGKDHFLQWDHHSGMPDCWPGGMEGLARKERTHRWSTLSFSAERSCSSVLGWPEVGAVLEFRGAGESPAGLSMLPQFPVQGSNPSHSQPAQEV